MALSYGITRKTRVVCGKIVSMKQKVAANLFVLVFFLLIVGLAFYLADLVRTDDSARALVESYGYLGILVTAIVGGLNFIVPVPAAAFTPVFLEAGYAWFTIILLLVIGTFMADTIGYLFGRAGRRMTGEKSKWIHKIEELTKQKPKLVVPIVFLYSSFVPLPNELILMPLGLAGFRFLTLILPLIFGNIVHQSLIAFGFSSVFNLLF